MKRASGLFTDLVDAKRILREIKLLRHFRHDNVATEDGASLPVAQAERIDDFSKKCFSKLSVNFQETSGV